MKHTGKLLTAGVLPLLVGYLLNFLLLRLPFPLPLMLSGLVLLGLYLWFQLLLPLRQLRQQRQTARAEP